MTSSNRMEPKFARVFLYVNVFLPKRFSKSVHPFQRYCLTLWTPMTLFGVIGFRWNLIKKSGLKGLYKKMKFLYGLVTPFFCARRSVMMILNLSELLAKPLVMAKLNMAYLSSSKNQQNCCRPTCRCHHLGYSVLPALHRTIWCRSTFGPRGPGLSNPTSFLRPALPMAPTRDDNARDKRSVLRPNPATFLRDFTLYMTTNYAIIWKRCLNYTARTTLWTPMTPFGVIGF